MIWPPRYVSRRTTPERDRALAAAHRSGATVAALAAAYGLGLRTAYRAIARSSQPYLVARMDGWTAQFVVSDEGPVQVTPWVPEP
jgi:hypothetical protein